MNNEEKNKQYVINITNGEGQENILNGNYSVSASVTGYDNDTVLPSTVEVKDDTTVLNFTIASTGTLTLHVTEEGTAEGTAIVGAKFIRCDINGNTYGTEITTNENGNAVFEHVPFAADGAPIVYYKQTASDGEHNFDGTLKNITLTEETTTKEVANPTAKLINVTLKDQYYTNLTIDAGTLTLE